MRRILIEENESNENEKVNTTPLEIVRTADCSDCSKAINQIVDRENVNKKRSHRGSSHNNKESLVKDFALSHHTADFCKNKKFSLKAMENIMKECLVTIGAQAVINNSSYKQLKKEIFNCIPYSDWFNPETFPTYLRLNHENNGLLV